MRENYYLRQGGGSGVARRDGATYIYTFIYSFMARVILGLVWREIAVLWQIIGIYGRIQTHIEQHSTVLRGTFSTPGSSIFGFKGAVQIKYNFRF